MAVMGRWGAHTFEVSVSKINPFSSFSTGSEKKKDDSKSKKAVTELEKVSFTITCNAHAGINPEEEYYSFRRDIGTQNYLYIHDQKWDSQPLELKSVTLGSVVMDDYGRFRTANIQLSFEEQNVTPKKKNSRATASTSEKKARKKTSLTKTAK